MNVHYVPCGSSPAKQQQVTEALAINAESQTDWREKKTDLLSPYEHRKRREQQSSVSEQEQSR